MNIEDIRRLEAHLNTDPAADQRCLAAIRELLDIDGDLDEFLRAREIGDLEDLGIEIDDAQGAAESAQLERLCDWAVSLSLPTGHADTVDDLLAEVGAHIRELQERANDLTAERDAELL